MADASEIRLWLLERIQDGVPAVEWKNSVLTYDTATPKTMGGIFTRSEMEVPAELCIQRSIVVQVNLATTQKATPVRPSEPAAQDALEALVQEVSDAVRASNLLEQGAKPEGYWYTKLDRVDYGYDSMGQLTRAEVAFTARSTSLWH